MTADGEKIAPGVLSKVDSLQMACLEHQSAISQGLDDVSARLARLKSVARMVQAQGPRGASTTDLAPKAQSYVPSVCNDIQCEMQAISCWAGCSIDAFIVPCDPNTLGWQAVTVEGIHAHAKAGSLALFAPNKSPLEPLCVLMCKLLLVKAAL